MTNIAVPRGMTGRVSAIARNTFREAIRNRVLYVIGAFAVVFLALTRFLGTVSVGQDVKIVKDMGLAAISLFGMLVAVLVGTSIVYQEIDRRTIYTILSKPVRRFEFVAGKYLGLCWTLTTVMAAMSLIFLIEVLASGAGIDATLLLAIALNLAELWLLTSVAVLLSCVASPLMSAVFTFGFYIIGHTIRNILALLDYVHNAGIRKGLSLIYFVLPNLDNFNIHREVVHGLPLPWAAIVYAVAYGIVYSLLMLSAASFVLSHRDL